MTTRYEKGLKEFEKIHSTAGKNKIEQLTEISPEFTTRMIENIGDIYSRDVIDKKIRSAITLSSHITQGSTELEVHFNVALNVGFTPDQIKEMIMHLTLYCGYPKCVHALLSFQKTLENRE